MLKLTKTGIGLLSKQYRSVLKRCLIVNLCILYPLISWSYDKMGMSPISGYNLIYQYVYDRYTTSNYKNDNLDIKTSLSVTSTYIHGSNFDLEQFAVDVIGGDFSYTKTQTDALLNYYYTFRDDKTSEVIEFAKELRNNKKDMSSLDFMPIKSSSDLRINLITAEDPLTFSTKTRDDSLVLREVCHA